MEGYRLALCRPYYLPNEGVGWGRKPQTNPSIQLPELLQTNSRGRVDGVNVVMEMEHLS
jgi:hypothetical protein